ncbi:hypothetical protein [Leifsonia aquatica]|uniref:hypothetical protein n=1 Tax=Leifsonia aquatica TaxID=144185 RepID=UPI0004697124|nr:hypothetical protein [Leifsonia aquatica]
MQNVTKRVGIIGAAAAATGLIVGGIALPANAATNDSEDTRTTTTVPTSVATDALDYLSVSDILHSVHVSPSVGDVNVGPLVGDVASGNTVGDVASGNPVASGNEANGNAVGSGNSAPIGSGNDTTAPIGSGNSTGNGASVGDGTDVGASVSDLGASISDSVKGTVDDALKGVTGTGDLGAVLGR